MNITVRGNRITITEAMESYAKEKLGKLEKYLENASEVSGAIVARVNGRLHTVEVTIPLKSFILRAEESQEDFYAAIDTVIDKLERQIRKNKTRIASKKNKEVKDFAYDVIEEVEDEPQTIVKRKKIEVKPMDEEEAITQMELLGHQFYLFRDIETNEPSLVYKRKDGNYGIIEAE